MLLISYYVILNLSNICSFIIIREVFIAMNNESLDFISFSFEKTFTKLHKIFSQKGNAALAKYYDKPAKLFSDLYSTVLGRPLSFYGKFPSSEYDRFLRILTDAFSPQIPFLTSYASENAVKYYMFCLKLASSDKASDAAYKAYKSNKEYYDLCYKEFLSYKPFSDFEKQAGIVAFNFNYNSERFGGFIFKILIPHVFDMPSRIQGDLLAVVNSINPFIGRFVKNTRGIDIYKFIDKYSLDYDTSPFNHDFIQLCIAFRFCAVAYHLVFDTSDNFNAIPENTCVSDTLTSFITDMTGYSFSFNRKYIPEFKNAPDIAFSYSGLDYTDNCDILYELFDASLPTADMPAWFKILLSRTSSELIALVTSEKWDLSSFIDMAAECFFDVAAVLPPFVYHTPLTDESQDKILDVIAGYCESWLICPGLDFIPSQYAGKQAITIYESSIIETFCLAVNNCTYDFDMVDKLNSVELWNFFSDFVKDFMCALLSRIAFKEYFDLRASVRFQDKEWDALYEEDKQDESSEPVEPVPVDTENTDSSKDYLDIIEKLKSELARKDKMLSYQAHEIASLEKTNEKLRSAIDKIASDPASDPEDDKPEAFKEPSLNADQMAEYINSLGVKLLIVGGHDATNRKLSEMLVNLTCTSSDKFDEKLIWNNDFIFINSSFVNHHIFYKVDRLCEKAGKSFNYLKGSNVFMTMEKIYQCVKEVQND